MARVVLGVTGSIAAYRAADLARDLMREGHEVRVCLTRAAAEFVTPALFEALTGQPCLQDVFEEPDRGRMAHIDWARQADLILIAPATADALNRLAAGVADDMLMTISLATTAPMAIAPAMNPAMYTHPTTQAALMTLTARGAWIIEPSTGDVACGENGQGKLAASAEIVAVARQILNRSQRLLGQRVLITSGPTQEPIDDVRFLSNRSSGKMGVALARAARWMGAEVTLVTGQVEIALPTDVDIVNVKTALEMLAAVQTHGAHSNLILGCAAVADYRPAHPVAGKLRRTEAPLNLELTPNPDIIAAAAASFPHARVVAFAAEPTADPATARAKMERKGVWAIAMNDVSRPGLGFGSDENELRLLTSEHEESSGVMSKLGCALWLLERVAPKGS
jgi:phosphopantothenoylcysteine decarboxylase/phosphopantothenate--cysteine ligase